MRFTPKRKFRVAAVRRMPRTETEELAGATMSFAKAIVVVVVLHLVAVGGIYAFSSLKARNNAQQNPLSHPMKETAAGPAATGDAGDTALKIADQPAELGNQTPAKVPATPVVAHDAASVEQPAKPPAGETTAPVKDSGNFYTVLQGDNPVAIARKLHVSYDDLLKLNKITDPKKLKIGQKLRIPAKKKSTPPT